MSEPRIPPPPRHGGFRGRYADFYDHAFTATYDVAWRAVTADPSGSGPAVYSPDRAIPIAAVGSADRSSVTEMAAVEAGARAGYHRAFEDARQHPPA